MSARDANGEPRGHGSGLPAPYRNPWRSLGDDLRAVAADLRLRFRGLWRRNREGSLWRPGWWPSDLAPLFWPISLALALLLGLTPLWLVARGSPAVPERSAAEPVAAEPATTPEPAIAAGSGSEMSRPPAAADLSEPAAAAATEFPAAPEPPATLAEPSTESSSEPSADPLLLWLREAPAAELLNGATTAPAATLVLQVQPPFLALTVPQRQQRAETWQLEARELGFDHLELRDGNGVLLARDALVGSGMIVLPAPPAP